MEGTFLGILIATFVLIGAMSLFILYRLYAGQR
jgi:hypothetical protein